MDLLTVKEVAELKKCSDRHIKQLIAAGKLSAQKVLNEKNRLKYLIPLETLPPELQKRYYQQKQSEAPVPPPKRKPAPIPAKTYAELTDEEREQVLWWSKTLEEWQLRRREYDSLTEGDLCCIGELKRIHRKYLAEHGITISKDVLYRKYAAYKHGDVAALLDRRGGWNRGNTAVPKEIQECFNALYLDDCQLPVSQCYQLTQEWAAQNYPEHAACMASERTFRRLADALPSAVVRYFRYGEKACLDECMPYIERLYDGIEANDVWVADNHTFDITTRCDGSDKQHRMYLTAFLDAKSGVLVGWNLTENPCSQSTVLALRHGILRHGIPRVVYVDNGSEFLTHDIGGRGHRKRKSSDTDQPPSILQLLGIEMRNALVRNARAKPIERCFLTLKNSVSRMFETFTGGNIQERPESLKWQLKHGEIPYDAQLRELIDLFIQGDYNAHEYGGSEGRYRGMSRMDVWNTSIQKRGIRKTTEQNLDLLLLRTSRYQKVKRNGVSIEVAGEKLWYTCADVFRYLDQEVYVRYDPAELDTVRVYNREGQYMATWAMDLELVIDYITDRPNEIASAEKKLRQSIRAVKQMGREATGGMTIDRLQLKIDRAHRNLDKAEIKQPSLIIPVYASEEPAERLEKVSGEPVVIDYTRMNQNAARRREE